MRDRTEMNFLHKLPKLLISLFCLCFAVNIFASERVGSTEDAVLRGLRGGLKAVVTPVDVALSRAEYQYKLNGGADLGAKIALVTSGTANDYIAELEICKKYFVKLKFQSARFDSDEITGGTVIPLPEPIFDKEIYFVPVAESGDSQITTFECITNFTLDEAVFQGDQKTGLEMHATDSARAILAKYTDHAIIEKCIYLDSTDWDTVIAASVTGASDCVLPT